ncbi:MAG TPA: endonuclease III [Elusimicrobiota bacterium]|nr:endonuclease III [Elusimicrobiota bacterium]
MKSSPQKILSGLKREYPEAGCALRHADPFQLLVATILSAQCTDERVNKVTPGLFKKYPTPRAFSQVDPKELEQEIRSTGFYHQKARWIIGASRTLVDRFGSVVPKEMDSLTQLTGVARKTANVVLGTAYGIAAGVVVDTHVKRLSQRMGFTKQSDPVKIERDLMALVPRKDWIWFSHAMILHGRRVCKAISPRCDQCSLRKDCPYPRASNAKSR